MAIKSTKITFQGGFEISSSTDRLYKLIELQYIWFCLWPFVQVVPIGCNLGTQKEMKKYVKISSNPYLPW